MLSEKSAHNLLCLRPGAKANTNTAKSSKTRGTNYWVLKRNLWKSRFKLKYALRGTVSHINRQNMTLSLVWRCYYGAFSWCSWDFQKSLRCFFRTKTPPPQEWALKIRKPHCDPQSQGKTAPHRCVDAAVRSAWKRGMRDQFWNNSWHDMLPYVCWPSYLSKALTYNDSSSSFQSIPAQIKRMLGGYCYFYLSKPANRIRYLLITETSPKPNDRF